DQINHGRNRNTAWWSILDTEWPRLKQAYNAWLSDGNFDSNGRQMQRLSSLF
ncbi:N-acetyltransferase, partial [Alphaproteobacteria bacterium]|nr:N-acetyltransferase [Alphaproteobacteria bacterium]